MEQAKIHDGNKLIAEFYKECKYVKYEEKSYLKCEGEKWKFPQSKEINKLYNNFPISDGNLGGLINPDFTLLKFHSSWDWLMPVVEKIETIETERDGHFGVFISSNTCMIQGTKLYLSLKAPKTYGFVYMSDPNAIFSTKLESTWYNVVEFIKWYNTQNQ